jgi:hypothetical protein
MSCIFQVKYTPFKKLKMDIFIFSILDIHDYRIHNINNIYIGLLRPRPEGRPVVARPVELKIARPDRPWSTF